MTPRELFGMLLRLLGVWLIISALENLPFSTYFMLRAGSGGEVFGAFLYAFSQPVVELICACFLIFYTDWFVQLFVPASDQVAVNMAPRDLFGVLARALGIWQLALGLGQLPRAVQSMRPYNDDREFVDMILNTFFSPGIHIIVGLFLLFGAGWLMRTSYRDTASTGDSDGQDGESQDRENES